VSKNSLPLSRNRQKIKNLTDFWLVENSMTSETMFAPVLPNVLNGKLGWTVSKKCNKSNVERLNSKHYFLELRKLMQFQQYWDRPERQFLRCKDKTIPCWFKDLAVVYIHQHHTSGIKLNTGSCKAVRIAIFNE